MVSFCDLIMGFKIPYNYGIIGGKYINKKLMAWIIGIDRGRFCANDFGQPVHGHCGC